MTLLLFFLCPVAVLSDPGLLKRWPSVVQQLCWCHLARCQLGAHWLLNCLMTQEQVTTSWFEAVRILLPWPPLCLWLQGKWLSWLRLKDRSKRGRKACSRHCQSWAVTVYNSGPQLVGPHLPSVAHKPLKLGPFSTLHLPTLHSIPWNASLWLWKPSPILYEGWVQKSPLIVPDPSPAQEKPSVAQMFGGKSKLYPRKNLHSSLHCFKPPILFPLKPKAFPKSLWIWAYGFASLWQPVLSLIYLFLIRG